MLVDTTLAAFESALLVVVGVVEPQPASAVASIATTVVFAPLEPWVVLPNSCCPGTIDVAAAIDAPPSAYEGVAMANANVDMSKMM
jgi:hypothetical protein